MTSRMESRLRIPIYLFSASKFESMLQENKIVNNSLGRHRSNRTKSSRKIRFQLLYLAENRARLELDLQGLKNVKALILKLLNQPTQDRMKEATDFHCVPTWFIRLRYIICLRFHLRATVLKTAK